MAGPVGHHAGKAIGLAQSGIQPGDSTLGLDPLFPYTLADDGDRCICDPAEAQKMVELVLQQLQPSVGACPGDSGLASFARRAGGLCFAVQSPHYLGDGRFAR